MSLAVLQDAEGVSWPVGLQNSGLGVHRARATDFGSVRSPPDWRFTHWVSTGLGSGCTQGSGDRFWPSDCASTVCEYTQGSGRCSTGLGLPILDLEVHMPLKNYRVHYNANLEMSRGPP